MRVLTTLVNLALVAGAVGSNWFTKAGKFHLQVKYSLRLKPSKYTS